MKFPWKRLFSVLMTLCILLSILCTAASAVTVRSSAYLDSYVCMVTARSGGEIVVSASVDAVIRATEIGATDVYIYESSNDVDYTCVEEYHAEDYPEMLDSGRHFNSDVATYEGTSGKYYYAVVYVYAGNSTGGDTRRYETACVRAIS